MKWILMFWLASNDSGFPNHSPGFDDTSYDTQEACLNAGKALKTNAYSHVTLYYCVQGVVPK